MYVWNITLPVRKKGLILSSIGILLGLATGFFILWAQRYAAEQLTALLYDEVKESTGCEYKVESIEVSLLTLKAHAGNARIECENEIFLLYEKLEAKFSLRRIREKIILLDNLHLSDGHAKGIGPESPTYKFIDSLVAPLPAHLDRPGRWKVKLVQLAMADTSFLETIGEQKVKGENLELLVQRTASDDFDIYPTIGNLMLENKQTLHIGKLKIELHITDDDVFFKKFSLEHGDSHLNMTGKIDLTKEDLLQGEYNYSLYSSDTFLSNYLAGQIEGKGELAGELENPSLEGSMQLPKDQSLAVYLPLLGETILEKISAKYAYHSKDGSTLFTLNKLFIEGENIKISEHSPLSLKDQKLSGRYKITINNISEGNMLLNNITADLFFSNELDSPSIRLSGKISEALFFESGLLADLEFNLGLVEQTLSYNLSHSSLETGKLQISGEINLQDDLPVIQQSDISADLFKLGKVMGLEGKLSNLLLNLKGKIEGVLEIEQLKGDLVSEFIVPFADGSASLKGRTTLDKAMLNFDLEDQNKVIHAGLELNLNTDKQSALKIRISDLSGSSIARLDKCLNLSSDLEYNFPHSMPLKGDGRLKIDKLTIGCEPYSLSNSARLDYQISEGVLQITPSSFLGDETSLQLKGTVSAESINIESNGTIQSRAFLGLIPNIDDLRGLITAQLYISGSVDNPQLSGQLKLDSGLMDIEAAGISVQDVNGNISITNDKLSFDAFAGKLNSGAFSLEGIIDLKDKINSMLLMKINNVITSPFEGLNLDLSGELALLNLNGGAPIISGDIFIESGEYQRNIELTNVLRTLPDYLFRSRKERPQIVKLPDIDLDLNLTAQRNLFVFTNWLNAELQAGMSFKGNLNDLLIIGNVETISGWLGFKDRKFEISSGKIIFSPGQEEPALELISEAHLLSRSGDIVQVILEIGGSISSPRVTLSSDRGLSERELVTLITSGSNLSARMQSGVFDRQFDFSENEFDIRSVLFSPAALVRYLTDVDSLSIEPSYNYLSGTIEPAVVARKRLLEKLFLEGESFLGSSQTLSRAQLIYSLTPSVDFAALVESLSTRKENAFEINSTYTILSGVSKFVDISISGNNEISRLAIQNSLRINESSRIPCEEPARMESNIERLYHARGYYSVKVQVESDCLDTHISRLHFSINEGDLSLVSEVHIAGDDISNFFDIQKLKNSLLKAPAGERLIEDLRKNIVNKLRSEGYVAARVNITYQNIETSEDKAVNINIFLGRPVTFTFRGNSVFSPEQFLETINLFERKLPLGSNTINLLIEGMEKLYYDEGYIYSTISYNKIESEETLRTNYLIEIEEGPMITVDKVIFEGAQKVSTDNLRRLIRRKYEEDFREFFYPRVAKAASIEYNLTILAAIYKERGFPYASISYKLAPNKEENKISIIYQIDEGEELRSDWLMISGLPAEIPYLLPDSSKYSIEKANQIITEINQALRDKGYYNASFSSTYADDEKKLAIYVEPGKPTIIEALVIEGNKKIHERDILKQLIIKEGDRWDNQKIIESKRRLLRLGLFSKVDFLPKDAEINSEREVMLIQVIERPLQSLLVGAGANSSFGAHIYAQATDRSLFKDGKSLSMLTDLYYDPTKDEVTQGIAGLRYAHPNLLGSDYNLSEDLRYQKLDTSAQEFNLDRVSLASYVYRNFGEDLSFSLGHTILEEELTSVSPDVIISEYDSGTVRLGFISGFISFDRRDAPLNPRKGYALNFDYKLASQTLGSEANFYSLGGRASWIRPLGFTDDRFSIAAATHFASSHTFASTSQVPISQRFYSGGRSTIRGFRENSLGPRGSEGGVIGGDMLFANNFELRYLVADNTSIHTFFDAGTVFLRDISTSFDDIRTSTGIGVRYLSPIGPIGFDVGHPLDEKAGEPSIRFHFSIGSNF